MARMVQPTTSSAVDVDAPRTTRSGSVPLADTRTRTRRGQGGQQQQLANAAMETDNNSRRVNPNNHPNTTPNDLAAIIEEGVQGAKNHVEQQLQSYAEAASGNVQQIDPQLDNAFAAQDVDRSALQHIDILKSLAPQVLNNLPVLAENANILLTYFEDLVSDNGNNIAEADIAALLVELHQGTSRAAQMFRKRADTLMQQSQTILLASTFDTRRYLQPSVILPALFNVNDLKDIPMQELGARDVIYMANLAIAVKDLLLLQAADPNVKTILGEIDNDFPNHFLATFGGDNVLPGSSALTDQAFSLGLSLRTQLVVRTWIADHNAEGFEPEDAINLQFYFGDVATMLNMWHIPDWQSAAVRGMLDNVLGTLRSMVGPNGEIDVAQLEQRFPLLQLQYNLCSFALARFHELTRILESKGGVRMVLDQLRSGVTQQARGTQLPVQPTQGTTTERKTSKRGGAKALKKAAVRVSGKGMMNVPDANQDDALLNYPDGTGVAGLYQTMEQPYGERRPGLFDRQPGAQRIQFDGDDSQPADAIFNTRLPISSAPDSSAPYNVTQDAGLPQGGGPYQQDNRDEALVGSQLQQAQMRASNARQWEDQSRGGVHEVPNTSFQPAAAGYKRTADMGQNLMDNDDQVAKRARFGAGDFISMDNGEGMSQMYTPPTSNYDHVNTLAKRAVALHNKSTKGPQQRKAWTTMETNALSAYITQYGISYTVIKAKDKELNPTEGILWQRDQVALKDKARNMKFDYLKAGIPLPPNFEHIPLNKIHRDKLSALGVEYQHIAQRASAQEESQLEE